MDNFRQMLSTNHCGTFAKFGIDSLGFNLFFATHSFFVDMYNYKTMTETPHLKRSKQPFNRKILRWICRVAKLLDR